MAAGGRQGRGNMNIKELPALQQINKLQELRDRYIVITKEINLIRKEYTEPGEMPDSLETIIKSLKIKYADEKIAESTAMVNPS
jgi:hypothetical protein